MLILDLEKVQISRSKQQQFLQLFLDLFGSPHQVTNKTDLNTYKKYITRSFWPFCAQGTIQKKSASGSWTLPYLMIFLRNFILIWKCQKGPLNSGTLVSATAIYQKNCPVTVLSALFFCFSGQWHYWFCFQNFWRPHDVNDASFTNCSVDFFWVPNLI